MEGLQPSDILIHIVNILVLFVLLRVILFKPVSRYLMARTDRIAEQLKDAETKQAEAVALKAAYEKHIETYEEEGRGIVRQSQIKANDDATAIVEEARGKAKQIIATAQDKIASDKAQAVAEARTEVALLATEIAARILKREVSVSDNTAVAEEFFRQSE